MKIVFNTYPAAFQCMGGGEIQLLKSKEALEALGHEVVLFDQWNTKLEDADVLHHFSVQGGSVNLCAYADSHNIPLVISPILWMSNNPHNYPMEEIQHLLSMADSVCTNSDMETDQFLNFFDVPNDKFILTCNGVDDIFTEKVDQDMFREEFDIKGKFVLCVGNIEARKNQHMLVVAAEKAEVKLVLIGHIRDQTYFETSGIEESNNTIYLGSIDHHSPLLRSAYQACELFVLPSLLETPGLAALEAVTCGAKLVITKEGSTTEYFNDSAVYVDPCDVESITAGITKAMIEVNPQVELDYSWARTGLQLERAYELAIKRRNNEKT
jgi:glycosyltransferase involved in cell wall biosynthesis